MDNEISTSEVLRKIENKENFVLLDVRTPGEHNRTHLKNSILIPLQDISLEKLNEKGIDQNDQTIIYCLSGPRSFEVCNILNRLGFKNIKYMTTGLMGWRANGYKYLESK